MHPKLKTLLLGVFDTAILLLTLVDAVSDVLVGVEFYRNESYKFAYAVAALFFLGCVSDCVGFLISMERRWSMDKWYHWVIYVAMLLPFAQLLPLANYLMTIFYDDMDFARSERVDWDADERNNNATMRHGSDGNNTHVAGCGGEASALLKTRADAESKKATVAEIDKAIVARHAAFLTLNIATVVESAPMCVIQLLAIGYSGTVTATQCFSLSLSLFNVIIKAGQLCRSFDIGALIFKILVLAHDVLSLAFTCVTVLQEPSDPSTARQFFGLTVSPLAYYWLSFKLVNAAIIAFIALVAAVKIVYEEPRVDEKFLAIGIMSSMFVLAPVPIAIVQEAAKLSWAIALNLGSAPQAQSVPKMPLLHEFLHHRTSDEKKKHQNQQQQPQQRNDGASTNSSSNSVDDDNDPDDHILDTTDWPATIMALERFFDDTCDRAHKISSDPRLRDEVLGRHNLTPLQQQLQTYGRRFRNRAAASDVLQVFQALWPKSTERLFVALQQPLGSDTRCYRRDNFPTRARHAMLLSGFHRFADFLSQNVVYWNQSTLFGRNRNANNNNNNRNPFARGGASPIQQVRDERDRILRKYEMCIDPGRAFGWIDFLAMMTLPSKEYIVPNRNNAAVRTVYRTDEILAFIAAGVIIALTVCTAVFGLLFPLLFVVSYGFTAMSTMAAVLFVPLMLCLAGAIRLVPAAFKYEMTCASFSYGMQHKHDCIAQSVDSYFSLPLKTLRTHAIPDSVIPRDAIDTAVLPFLDQRMLGLWGVRPGSDFHSIREQVVRDKDV